METQTHSCPSCGITVALGSPSCPECGDPLKWCVASPANRNSVSRKDRALLVASLLTKSWCAGLGILTLPDALFLEGMDALHLDSPIRPVIFVHFFVSIPVSLALTGVVFCPTALKRWMRVAMIVSVTIDLSAIASLWIWVL